MRRAAVLVFADGAACCALSKPEPAGSTRPPVRALATGLVDYAGLFPPAQLGMSDAMRNYAEYLRGPHSWILGRFVIPIARLGEFDAASAELLSSGEGSVAWKLAALASDDLAADVQAALKFNCRHWQGSELGHAIIDTIEMRVQAGLDPAMARAAVPDFFTLYLEAAGGKPAAIADSAEGFGVRAKIRMGGVTGDAFPAATDVIDFLAACAARRLPFKATAGLHHLIRSEYPLTYESDSKRAAMYGFLNVFIAAAALYAGASRDIAHDILMESDLNAFSLGDTGITWRGLVISTDDISGAREFAASFGSCSFREPVDEMLAAGLIG